MEVKELLDRYANGERDFTKADLREAKLIGANLSGADLRGANLSWADLSWANLSWADLSWANLSWADLSWANLSWAYLEKTCLDPCVGIPKCDLSELNIDGEYVIGYRTKRSQHCGNSYYMVGEGYTAPYFSVDTETPCHPGIYLAPMKWLERTHPNEKYVKVKALTRETIKAGDKYRAKRIWVIEDVTEAQEGE